MAGRGGNSPGIERRLGRASLGQLDYSGQNSVVAVVRSLRRRFAVLDEERAIEFAAGGRR